MLKYSSLVIISLILFSALAGAVSIGTTNSRGVIIRQPDVPSPSINGSTLTVNDSYYLRGLSPQQVADLYTETDPLSIHADAINTTQLEYTGGVLSILQSWLDGMYCRLTGCMINGNLTIVGTLNASNVCYSDGTNCAVSPAVNPFNQSLNTTDQVKFSRIEAQELYMKVNASEDSVYYLNISNYGAGFQVPTLKSNGFIYIVAQSVFSGYFSSTGFNLNDNNGMAFGTAANGAHPVIFASTSTQTNGSSRMVGMYIGLPDKDYSAPNYLGSRTAMIGDATNRSINRFIQPFKFPTLLWLPPGNERNIYGGINHNNDSFNIFTNNGNITLSAKSGDTNYIILNNTLQTTLSGSGNAYACLDSNGRLYRSASPCV